MKMEFMLLCPLMTMIEAIIIIKISNGQKGKKAKDNAHMQTIMKIW